MSKKERPQGTASAIPSTGKITGPIGEQVRSPLTSMSRPKGPQGTASATPSTGKGPIGEQVRSPSPSRIFRATEESLPGETFSGDRSRALTGVEAKGSRMIIGQIGARPDSLSSRVSDTGAGLGMARRRWDGASIATAGASIATAGTGRTGASSRAEQRDAMRKRMAELRKPVELRQPEELVLDERDLDEDHQRRAFESFKVSLNTWLKAGDLSEKRGEAARRIIDAYKKDRAEEEDFTLDLSGLGLKSIPGEIGKFVFLKKLNVSGNELESLPEDLFSNLLKAGRSYPLGINLTNNKTTVETLSELYLKNHQSNFVKTLPTRELIRGVLESTVYHSPDLSLEGGMGQPFTKILEEIFGAKKPKEWPLESDLKYAAQEKLSPEFKRFLHDLRAVTGLWSKSEVKESLKKIIKIQYEDDAPGRMQAILNKPELSTIEAFVRMQLEANLTKQDRASGVTDPNPDRMDPLDFIFHAKKRAVGEFLVQKAKEYILTTGDTDPQYQYSCYKRFCTLGEDYGCQLADDGSRGIGSKALASDLSRKVDQLTADVIRRDYKGRVILDKDPVAEILARNPAAKPSAAVSKPSGSRGGGDGCCVVM